MQRTQKINILVGYVLSIVFVVAKVVYVWMTDLSQTPLFEQETSMDFLNLKMMVISAYIENRNTLYW